MAFKRFIRMAGLLVLWLFVVPATPAAAEAYRIVAFGDSLMAGYQLGPGEAFPEQLEAALRDRGHAVEVANAGVSGDTTSGGLSRLDWSVPHETDLVILGLGANDMLRGVDPAVTRTNLEQMIERLKARGIEIVLIGMLAAPNLGMDYKERFNAIYPDLAEKHGLAFYPFFLEGVATDRRLLLEDGMHPNALGVQRMVAGVLPFVEPFLSETEGGG
jgi:acyl-CoA thioesterase-1